MIVCRRRCLQGLVGAAGLAAVPLAAQMLTPRQTAGPFYPDLPLLDDDNDLTRIPGSNRVAKGRLTDLSGRVLDRNGSPLPEFRIEIWQCDANGSYRHSRDPRRENLDPGFQGFGHTLSDAAGRYRFRTIRPVPYPGRTPHIHVAIYPPRDKPFVTQLYVAGEQGNADDFLYRRIPVERRALVTVPFAEVGNGMLSADWDIYLGVS